MELKKAILENDQAKQDEYRINDPDFGIYSVFLENSTRTRESFKNAAKFHHAKFSELLTSGSSIKMGISIVIALFCGVALFLYGMTLMGDGLKAVAGSKLEMVLYKLSGTPFKGVLLGTGITAIIQSSSATSIMTVGFVNS